MKKKIFLSVLLVLLLNSFTYAQIPQETELFKEIVKLDSILFDEGFNKCNYDALAQVTVEDLEFYHDQGGITMGKKAFLETTRKNICSINYRPIRKLDRQSLEIYPLKSNGHIYGAIQKGVHEFYALEEGKEAYLTSVAKFTHLWIKKEEKWLLKRVLSYDHQSPENNLKFKKDIFGDRRIIEAWLKEHKVPAMGIAVLKNKRLSEVMVYGNLSTENPAPYHTLFNIASLTKPVVSMLTLKLVENGDWELDAPLEEFWTDPDVKNDTKSKLLTTRHILSHQSGFKNWRRMNVTGKLEFDFEPGTAYNYSGEGFEYLRKALENKFEKPIQELADSLLFQPLKMKETRFTWDESVEESRFAKWHDVDGNQAYETYKNTTASAADDLVTTLEDYGKFAEYILNGAGLSEELFEEMVRQQNGAENGVKMGLGWEILQNLKREEYAILHTGGDIGVHTLVMLLPRTGEGLVIFTNGDNGNTLFFKLIEEHLSLGKKITGKA